MSEALSYISEYDNPESETDAELGDAANIAVDRDAGFQSNPRVRGALEQYAMARACKELTKLGLNPKDKHTIESFDFLCTRPDGSNLYVEVKGTQTDGRCVIVTPHEVELAQKRTSALFIGHSVHITPGDQPVASGGCDVFVNPWIPTSEDLTPIQYFYRRPQR